MNPLRRARCFFTTHDWGDVTDHRAVCSRCGATWTHPDARICVWMQHTVSAACATYVVDAIWGLPHWVMFLWVMAAVGWAFAAHYQWDRRVHPAKWARFDDKS